MAVLWLAPIAGAAIAGVLAHWLHEEDDKTDRAPA